MRVPVLGLALLKALVAPGSCSCLAKSLARSHAQADGPVEAWFVRPSPQNRPWWGGVKESRLLPGPVSHRHEAPALE